MAQSAIFAMVLVAIAGALVSVQAPMNAALGRGIGSPVAAAAVSFAVGLALLVLVTVLLGQSAAFAKVSTVSPWLLLGGAFGAIFVFSALWAVPILGVLTTTILVIAGQLVAATLLDAVGAFGIEAREISFSRLAAIALVAAGAVLSQW